jgi:hypothetical protein
MAGGQVSTHEQCRASHVLPFSNSRLVLQETGGLLPGSNEAAVCMARECVR